METCRDYQLECSRCISVRNDDARRRLVWYCPYAADRQFYHRQPAHALTSRISKHPVRSENANAKCRSQPYLQLCVPLCLYAIYEWRTVNLSSCFCPRGGNKYLRGDPSQMWGISAAVICIWNTNTAERVSKEQLTITEPWSIHRMVLEGSR